MNYPKMLYKGEAKYTDNDQLRNDLYSKELKTIIVTDHEQEEMRRDQGYVDLADLMYKQKPKTPTVEVVKPMEEGAGLNIAVPEVTPRVKRKYTRKVQNVGHDTA